LDPEDEGIMYLQSLATLPTPTQCNNKRMELSSAFNYRESLKSVNHAYVSYLLTNMCDNTKNIKVGIVMSENHIMKMGNWR
jgi:hypothetical protein